MSTLSTTCLLRQVRYIAPWVLKRRVRFAVMAAFLGLAAASGYGASRLTTDTNLTEAYPFDSYIITYSSILADHFYAQRAEAKVKKHGGTIGGRIFAFCLPRELRGRLGGGLFRCCWQRRGGGD